MTNAQFRFCRVIPFANRIWGQSTRRLEGSVSRPLRPGAGGALSNGAPEADGPGNRHSNRHSRGLASGGLRRRHHASSFGMPSTVRPLLIGRIVSVRAGACQFGTAWAGLRLVHHHHHATPPPCACCARYWDEIGMSKSHTALQRSCIPCRICLLSAGRVECSGLQVVCVLYCGVVLLCSLVSSVSW